MEKRNSSKFWGRTRLISHFSENIHRREKPSFLICSFQRLIYDFIAEWSLWLADTEDIFYWKNIINLPRTFEIIVTARRYNPICYLHRVVKCFPWCNCCQGWFHNKWIHPNKKGDSSSRVQTSRLLFNLEQMC